MEKKKYYLTFTTSFFFAAERYQFFLPEKLSPFHIISYIMYVMHLFFFSALFQLSASHGPTSKCTMARYDACSAHCFTLACTISVSAFDFYIWLLK